jgi:hypothetical protein
MTLRFLHDPSPKSEPRIEAEVALGLLARNNSVIFRDIVDAVRPFTHGKQRGPCRGIDMQRGL